MLQNVLPKEGDFVTLKLVRKLRETLSFSEKEIEAIEFKNNWRCPKCGKIELATSLIKCNDCGVYMQPAGQVTWDEEKATSVIKDIHMGGTMISLCTDVLKKLSAEQKLTEQHMSLYEKFVEGEEKDEEE